MQGEEKESLSGQSLTRSAGGTHTTSPELYLPFTPARMACYFYGPKVMKRMNGEFVVILLLVGVCHANRQFIRVPFTHNQPEDSGNDPTNTKETLASFVKREKEDTISPKVSVDYSLNSGDPDVNLDGNLKDIVGGIEEAHKQTEKSGDLFANEVNQGVKSDNGTNFRLGYRFQNHDNNILNGNMSDQFFKDEKNDLETDLSEAKSHDELNFADGLNIEISGEKTTKNRESYEDDDQVYRINYADGLSIKEYKNETNQKQISNDRSEANLSGNKETRVLQSEKIKPKVIERDHFKVKDFSPKVVLDYFKDTIPKTALPSRYQPRGYKSTPKSDTSILRGGSVNNVERSAKRLRFATKSKPSGGSTVSATKLKSDEHILVEFLFDGYNKHIRPTMRGGDVSEVFFEISLLNVMEMDTRNRLMKTNCEMIQKWFDYHLAWKPEDYGGVNVIRVPFYDLWYPDIVLHNTAEPDYASSILNTYAIIMYDGSIELVSHAIFTSICDVNVEYYPFDQQTCELIFSSWSYDKTEIIMKNGQPQLGHYVPNPEYFLENFWSESSEEYNDCCAEPFSMVRYKVQLQRRLKYPLFFFIMPGILINICAILVFSLPAETGEKVGLGINSMLAMIVFLMAMTNNLPPTNDLPLAGIYYGVCLSLIAVNIAFSVYVLNLNFTGFRGFPVPNFMRKSSTLMSRFLLIKVPDTVIEDWGLEVKGKGFSLPPTPDDQVKTIETKEPPPETIHQIFGTEKTKLDNTVKDPYESKFLEKLERVTQLMKKQEKRTKKADDRLRIQSQWKFMSRVLDRFLFLLFFFVALGFNIYLLTASPFGNRFDYCPIAEGCEGMSETEVRDLISDIAHHTYGEGGGGHGGGGDGGHGGGDGGGGGGHGGGAGGGHGGGGGGGGGH